MRRSGCTLAQILMAGQWRSISFLKYLDEVLVVTTYMLVTAILHMFAQADLEKETAFAVAIESDEEEWID